MLPLYTLESPLLPRLMNDTMQPSDNLYAEAWLNQQVIVTALARVHCMLSVLLPLQGAALGKPSPTANTTRLQVPVLVAAAAECCAGH